MKIFFENHYWGQITYTPLLILCFCFCIARGAAISFTYTGAVQEFTVEPGSLLDVTICGAQGGNGGSTSLSRPNGSPGSCVSATITVPNAVSKLYIYVGGQPQPTPNFWSVSGGGWNGGGAGSCCYDAYRNTFYGTGGGGASDIRTSSSVDDRLIVAGGGGGSGSGCHESCGGSGYVYRW